jgi:penicillin-binding protein 2
MTAPSWAPRVTHVAVVAVLMFVALAGRLWSMQAVDGRRYLELSEQNRMRDYVLAAPRGVIYDRRGAPIVTNRAAFTVSVLPMEVRQPERLAEVLGPLLKMDAAEILEKLRAGRRRPFEPVPLRRDAGKPLVVTIEENRLDLPGVVIQAEPVRDYVLKDLASHALGYLGEITEDELRAKPGYRGGDLIGKTGVERTYNDELRGEGGYLRVEVDAAGRPVRVIGRKATKPGRSLVLNIDATLQRAAEDALRGRWGAVVAMDPRNGEVLVLASSPTYDPSAFSGGISASNWRALTRDRRYPLVNRSTEGAYEPGSVFKIVTGTAALAEGVATRNTVFNCNGQMVLGKWVFRDLAAYGTIPFLRGVMVSCNVMFWTLGRSLGEERIGAYATGMGLGTTTGIDLPAESSGFIPSTAWKRRTWKEPWYPGDTLNMAIGQGFVLTTPLQIARMVSAVANGGTLVRPLLARRLLAPDGTPVRQFAAETAPLGIRVPAEALQTMREGLRMVVEGGTGRAAAVPGLSLAGKTGSAENPRGLPHAWFAGYGPVENPQLVVVAFVEHGRRGGEAAAPIVKAVFEAAKPLLGVQATGQVRP